jgi:spermidine synthase
MHQQANRITERGYYDEVSPLQRSSTRYEVSRCLFAGQTDYAHTVIVSNPDYGRMLFLDGELQSASYDEPIYHETLVHPIMNAMNHVDDKLVLVVGGAEGATVREVLKWGPNKVRHVDWVDIDSRLVDVCREHLQYADSSLYEDNYSVRFFGQDIMAYLRDCERKYHCIIIDLPDPDPNEQILYKRDFWDLINRSLAEGGMIVTHVGPVEPGQGRQPGLDIVRRFMGFGYPYHTFIPSFQSEWGFWMSSRPVPGSFPQECTVANEDYQSTIFHWDRHWQV